MLFVQLMLFDPGERVKGWSYDWKINRMNSRYTGIRRYISFIIKEIIIILEYFCILFIF